MADHPRMFVFNYARLTFLCLWQWPWPDDIVIRSWPRYFEAVPAYQKRSF